MEKTDTINESCKDKLDTRAKLFLYGDNKNIMICIDNWNTDICNQCYNTSSELKQALEKTFQNFRLLLQVISEQMQESWRQMDWAIQYQSKVLQSIGERIFLYSEEFLLKSRPVR